MLVPIEVTKYFGSSPVTTQTMVSPAAADEIRVLASELSSALDRRDMSAAVVCVHALQGYGISFGPQYLPLMNLQGIFSHTMAIALHPASAGPDENLSNSACILNAHGEGMLLGPITENFIKQISEVLSNASGVIEALVLLIILLPLIVTVILFNALIPLRLMMSHGVLALANGTISTRGAQGHKIKQVSGAEHAQVNVTLFTGITLNILPFNNRKPFCLISGFAAKTEGFVS
jgi:hypothetical protein